MFLVCIEYESFLSEQLRTYATKYRPHLNLFNTLYTVCFMHGLSIYKIKNMSPHSFFHNLNFPDIALVFNVKLKQLLSSSSFYILILVIDHDLKPFRKRENLFVFPSCNKILEDIFW